MEKQKKNLSVRAILLIAFLILGLFLLILSISSISGLQTTRKSAQKLAKENIRNLIDFDEINYTNQKLPKMLYELWTDSDYDMEEIKKNIEIAKDDVFFYLDEAKGHDYSKHSELFQTLKKDLTTMFANVDLAVAALEKQDRESFDKVMEKNQSISSKIDENIYSLIEDNDSLIKSITKSQVSVFNRTMTLAVVLITQTSHIKMCLCTLKIQ